MKNMNVYYALWSDAIHYERVNNGGTGHWKFFTFFYMSLLLSLNILSCLNAILFFTGYNIASEMRQYLLVSNIELVNNALWAVVVLFVPSMGVTYFSIFYRNKYEYILSRYKFRNGILLLVYFFVTVIFIFGFGLLNM